MLPLPSNPLSKKVPRQHALLCWILQVPLQTSWPSRTSTPHPHHCCARWDCRLQHLKASVTRPPQSHPVPFPLLPAPGFISAPSSVRCSLLLRTKTFQYTQVRRLTFLICTSTNLLATPALLPSTTLTPFTRTLNKASNHHNTSFLPSHTHTHRRHHV